ncbi:MAG TPA: class I SAM-dependent methyltransferase [Acidocella sp.]|nr:class I SAM-dependent methyltransferase [Acidocella sp.]
MIWPNATPTIEAVAAHYDELDNYYREVWGDHVHHGYWVTGRESPETAVEALIDLLADRLDLMPGHQVCDIGCGYGATAQHLAEHHHLHVTGVTVSAAQAKQAQARIAAAGSVSIHHMDWLSNCFAASCFDRAYAIESSEHMLNKQLFFSEAFRTLKPGGRFAVCAWLTCDDPRPWETRHLLEPICREGQLASMGNEADYCTLAKKNGFNLLSAEDLSDRVSRTWWICVRRLTKRLVTQPDYIKFLLDRTKSNRVFAITLFRLLMAYRTRSMRYCLLTFDKPTHRTKKAAAF